MSRIESGSETDVSFLGSWLPFGKLRATAQERAAALATPRIEDIEDPLQAATMLACGAEATGALPVMSTLYDGAIYSSRGRGYADYNEDAAALFRDHENHMYATVCDQAGGLGGKVRGDASGLAAGEIFKAFQRVARKDPTAVAHRPTAILTSFFEAHQQLLNREQSEVTTAVGAIFDADSANILSSGDSGAIHFDAEGRVKAATELQEFPPPNEGCLRHALGLEPEGCNPINYEWVIEPGDWVIMATDGLFDARLDGPAVGKILKKGHNAERALNELCATVLRRMGTLRAKPDNLTVVTIRRTAI